MWSFKRLVGNKGEDHAVKFLKKQGFKVLDRNYLRKCGEIDIVGYKKGKYHFIEVKTVTRETLDNNDFRAEDNLHRAKLERLARTISLYLDERNLLDMDWQIDAITVIMNKRGELIQIEYLEHIGW